MEIYWADAREKDELIDFCDYVFSKAHRPHDFASLLPKLYGARGEGAAHHVVIREGGRIEATLAAWPTVMRVGKERLAGIGVGSKKENSARNKAD